MGNSAVGLILYMAFFFALMYFLIIRPQKKKSKQAADLRNSVRTGDYVTTIGGIVGKVTKVKEEEFTLEVGSAKTKLQFKKWAISTVDKASNSAVEVEFEDASDEE